MTCVICLNSILQALGTTELYKRFCILEESLVLGESLSSAMMSVIIGTVNLG